MAETAITPRNLISKLCFTKYGFDTAENRDLLKKDMYRFIRQKSYFSITRQTIKYWFDKNSEPSRTGAYEMLFAYFKSEIKRDKNLEPERKKVFDQINLFLARQSSPKEPKNVTIGLSPSRRVVIDYPITEEDIVRLVDSIKGVFILYHMRLTEDADFPVAVEVMEVFRRGNEVRFNLWFRNDAEEVSVYRGTAIVLGQLIWFFGVLSDDNTRLRVMNFRNISGAKEKFGDIRWGLITSDIPRPSAHDPVACRVVLQRIKENVGDAAQFAQSKVLALSQSDLATDQTKILSALVSNNIDASSVVKREFSDLFESSRREDLVLKVNQEAIEKCMDRLVRSLKTFV